MFPTDLVPLQLLRGLLLSDRTAATNRTADHRAGQGQARYPHRLLTPGEPSRKLGDSKPLRRVSEWLAATLEMWCRETGCEFESRALRFVKLGCVLL